MPQSIHDLLALYNPSAPLDHAYTIPAPWYRDPQIESLEKQSVFAGTWQAIGRLDQLRKPGDFFTADIAGEPIVVVRGDDNQLRAFFNVCRHHAAAVVPESHGCAKQFRCPYHGWTYGIDGALKGMVEFDGVCNFDRADNGLVPIRRRHLGEFRLRQSRRQSHAAPKIPRRRPRTRRPAPTHKKAQLLRSPQSTR